MAEKKNNIHQALTGLNMDTTALQRKEGTLSYALNSLVQGFDGESLVIQSEQSNEYCHQLPALFQVVGGPFNITQIGKVIYFLGNSQTGDSQIGYVAHGDCNYISLVEGNCLGFDPEHPIHQLVVKSTNCATQFYWTDNWNQRRYLDLDNLPWKEIKNPDNDFKPTMLVGQLDCNKLLVQPQYSVPSVHSIGQIIGGSLKMGVYQAGVQYADYLGNGLTSVHNISNPFSIYKSVESENTDLPTDKAIEYKIENLDTTGLYDFFNLIIIETINDISTPKLATTLSITGSIANYVYTGGETSIIRLSMQDVFLKQKYYDRAGGVFTVDNVIGWYDLTSPKEVNYFSIWRNIKLLWETHRIPYNKFEGYTNGYNTESYKGYMRDEVYPLEGVLVKRNGMETASFPIPGRPPHPSDIVGINITNTDAVAILQNPCDDPHQKAAWQVYNTASLIGYAKEYLDYQGDDSCYKGAYQYGEMSYWESTDKYPNNPDIWGPLAGKPIRHHKFPDSLVTHIHDNNPTGDQGYEHAIYPIGIRIEGLKEAIDNSGLSQEDKDDIVGFKIIRGNRANNKSVVAKGMFNNVGRYTYIPDAVDEEDEQTYYYPNYPFNDLRPDPYFTTRKLKSHAGFRPSLQLPGFSTEDSHSRFVFYSPDTQFKQPFGIDSGHIKMETIEYGESYGHFVSVDKNAKYLLLNKNGHMMAYGAGVASTINGQVTYETPWSYGVGAHFSPENFPTTYQAMMDLLEKILPKTNMGYSFNSIGYYNKSYPIPNNGDKIRNISFGKYLQSEYESIEPGHVINNYHREQSVYINANSSLLFPHQYDPSIPEDNSRYNISSYTNNDAYGKFLPRFLSNPDVVTDADIYRAIADNFYGGSDVINIQYTGNSTGVVSYNPTAPKGSPAATVELYTTVGGKKLGTMQIIASGSNPSGSAYDGDFTGILTQGDINDITTYLNLDSSDHSGSGPATVVYSDEPKHAEVYVWGATAPAALKFDRLVTQTYQAYAMGRQDEADKILDQVKKLWPAIATEDDIETLNIIHPYGNEDFVKQVAYGAYINAYTRFQATLEKQYSPDKIRPTNICSYYGSIKKELPAQWGSIHSYDLVDTGYYSTLRDANGDMKNRFSTVFGGDIFIGRHAFKIKLPFFEQTTVGDPYGADVEYDKMASLTYPMFWLSTRPPELRSAIADFVERKTRNIIANGQTLNAFQTMVAGADAVAVAFKILKEVLAGLGEKNINLDNYSSAELYEQGIMYLFAYGIPYYFCESEINVDYRQATNSKEGDFYPHVSGDIPDQWLQEINVPISTPELFTYNNTYSKQNKESFYYHLRPDWDPLKACFYSYNNLTIWSDKSTLEETKNNWLTYRSGNTYDFPKSYGQLIALDRLQNRLVLARFENKSQLYNAMVTINTSSPEAAYLGNDSLFSGTPPIDLNDSTGGSFGSQHKFLLNTEHGNIFTDAKRGQFILLKGQQPEDISLKGTDKWSKHFLPFFIYQISPDIPTDNHLAGLGITGVYDGLYDRAIITKLDYEPIVEGITYNEDGEFIFDGKTIALTDNNYFCDRSWTLSYSFITESWTSFHSYHPNFYIEHEKYFQSGRNGIVSDVWDHNKVYSSYHNYYGTTYPYIIEYPITYGINDEILQSITDYTKALIYTDYETFTSPKDTHYFSKAIIFSDQECTGILNLVPKPKGLGAYMSYPKYNLDSKDILVTKGDNLFHFNQFWNITKNPDEPIWKRTCSFGYTNKALNFSNLDYSKKMKRPPMRSKECYIRLIEDNNSSIRLISRFLITDTQTSYK